MLRTDALLWAGFPTNWYWRSHMHSEGLVLGVWLAYIFLDRPTLWLRLRSAALPLALLPILLLAFQKTHPHQSPGFQSVVFLLYAVGYMAWVRLLYDLRWEPSLAPARLLKNGVHGLALASYSIYLLHTLLFTDIRVLIDGWPRGPMKSATILLSTLAVSVLFYFAVERPVIALRDRVLDR